MHASLDTPLCIRGAHGVIGSAVTAATVPTIYVLWHTQVCVSRLRFVHDLPPTRQDKLHEGCPALCDLPFDPFRDALQSLGRQHGDSARSAAPVQRVSGGERGGGGTGAEQPWLVWHAFRADTTSPTQRGYSSGCKN